MERLDRVQDKDLPRWIRYSYRKKRGKEPAAIMFAITEKCAENIAQMLRDCRWVEDLQSTFKFGAYEPDLTKGFGFDGAMSYAGNSGGYVHLAMPLAEGRSTYALSASCAVLSAATDYHLDEPKKGGDASRTQLLIASTWLRLEERFRGFHGAPMGGQTSPRFTEWLKERHAARDPLTEVDAAIHEAYSAFIPKERDRRSVMKSLKSVSRISYSPNGKFGLHCPGNACDIGTYHDLSSWREEEGGYGYEFSCHNLDSPQQQLALLAGLAKLYDLASADLDPKPS